MMESAATTLALRQPYRGKPPMPVRVRAVAARAAEVRASAARPYMMGRSAGHHQISGVT